MVRLRKSNKKRRLKKEPSSKRDSCSIPLRTRYRYGSLASFLVFIVVVTYQVKMWHRIWGGRDDDDSQRARKALSIIHLLGERNSDTEIVEDWFVKAFHPKYSRWNPNPNHPPFGINIPVFEYKHMFRYEPLTKSELEKVRNASEILWVLAVENPCVWADRMYREPHHLCRPDDCDEVVPGPNFEAVANVDRGEFFAMSWSDSKEKEKTKAKKTKSKKTAKKKRHRYENIFALRATKLRHMLQVMEEAKDRVVVVHLDKFEAAPMHFIEDLARRFHLRVNSKMRNSTVTGNPRETLCLTDDEWKIAHDSIDWEMESKFGFIPLDCHTCFGPQ